jgi:alpha-1,3-mannosyltransferase
MNYGGDKNLHQDNILGNKMQDKRQIGPVTFEVSNQRSALKEICSAIDMQTSQVFAFCNMHTFNIALRKSAFAKALNETIIFNDGLGIDVASLILFGKKFPENLNGTDLTPALLSSFNRRVSVFLVGSKPGVASKAAISLSMLHPNLDIVGTRHGFFDERESPLLVKEIRDAKTELLIVGMGNPRQELWATSVAAETGAVILCVGAFIDFAAGRVSRAPFWIRRLRCEWIYRMFLEPSRLWRRYLGGAVPFVCAVVFEKMKQVRPQKKI